MNKTVKIILEIAKLVISAILGYFGGNAIMQRFNLIWVRTGYLVRALLSTITAKMTQLV